MSDELRRRLYGSYVSARRSPAPSERADFESYEPYLDAIVRRHFVPDRDAAIFELGCGHGALLQIAREAGYRRLRGVDASAEQVAAAARLGVEGVEKGDLLETLRTVPEGSQAMVVAFDVLEHFGRNELLPLVDTVRRVLRPEGRFLLHVPNGESPFFGAVRYGDLTHELAFTRHSLAQLLIASDFRSVECFEDTPPVHGARSLLRRVLWGALRTGLRLCVAAETGDTGRGIFSRSLLAVAIR